MSLPVSGVKPASMIGTRPKKDQHKRVHLENFDNDVAPVNVMYSTAAGHSLQR